MSGIPGVTCARCLGRIDDLVSAFKRRACNKLGKPYSPPKFCSECVIVLMLDDGSTDDSSTEAIAMTRYSAESGK